MKIVILDGHVTNPGDLSWKSVSDLGELTVYERTGEGELMSRAKAAEILVVNKFVLDSAKLAQLPDLKCICLLATGYNNIDIQAAEEQGIIVCNAVNYSTDSVAQHVFALLLGLITQVERTSATVKDGEWSSSKDWSYYPKSLTELSGQVLGIFGLGRIGKQVAAIGQAFGMTVIATKKSKQSGSLGDIKIMDNDELLKESDIISLHAPLTEQTEGFFDKQRFSKMKDTAYLINTGRGGLVNEADLYYALLEGQIAGAGVDVLTEEPPPPDHILLQAQNCLITPHQAWATPQSRARLIKIVAANISAFINGDPINVVK